VRAPIEGRIAALPAIVGGAVEAGSLVATIVPEGGVLNARLFVATRAIGKVHAGQAVTIRYDAFPYQKYGTFKGRVADVSNSVLMPEDVARLSPVRLTEPAYVLDVAIERRSVAIGGDRSIALRPDMLLTATIDVDEEPLLAWIGESIFGVTQREP
jgi:membrane fusion protein